MIYLYCRTYMYAPYTLPSLITFDRGRPLLMRASDARPIRDLGLEVFKGCGHERTTSSLAIVPR